MQLTGEPSLQLVQIRQDAYGYADMADGFLRLIVIERTFEDDFFRIADALLSEGGVFVDVGANHGLISFGLAAKHGSAVEFHLFEPNRALLPALEKSRALYPHMRCVINTVAVSDTVGRLAFAIDRDQTGASHLDPHGAEEVASTTIDMYAASAPLTRIDLLKLDVEGYELSALRGARDSLEKRIIKAVYFEYFEKWLRRVSEPREVINFLASVGFVTCYCRKGDLQSHGGATRTLRPGKPGYGLPLRPVEEGGLPQMTDLLAVPREHLSVGPASGR